MNQSQLESKYFIFIFFIFLLLDFYVSYLGTLSTSDGVYTSLVI